DARPSCRSGLGAPCGLHRATTKRHARQLVEALLKGFGCRRGGAAALRWWSLTLGILLMVAAAVAVPAPAQTTPAGVTKQDREREYDAAFQETLKQPANLDVLFRFAAIAAQTGDLEGAISALERMLLINADLPRVRLELGVLYYRLKSYEVARTYLEGTLKSAGLPDDVRTRAEEFLAQTNRNGQASQFS